MCLFVNQNHNLRIIQKFENDLLGVNTDLLHGRPTELAVP
jgi:hypothetical protein